MMRVLCLIPNSLRSHGNCICSLTEFCPYIKYGPAGPLARYARTNSRALVRPAAVPSLALGRALAAYRRRRWPPARCGCAAGAAYGRSYGLRPFHRSRCGAARRLRRRPAALLARSSDGGAAARLAAYRRRPAALPPRACLTLTPSSGTSGNPRAPRQNMPPRRARGFSVLAAGASPWCACAAL